MSGVVESESKVPMTLGRVTATAELACEMAGTENSTASTCTLVPEFWGTSVTWTPKQPTGIVAETLAWVQVPGVALTDAPLTEMPELQEFCRSSGVVSWMWKGAVPEVLDVTQAVTVTCDPVSGLGMNCVNPPLALLAVDVLPTTAT